MGLNGFTLISTRRVLMASLIPVVFWRAPPTTTSVLFSCSRGTNRLRTRSNNRFVDALILAASLYRPSLSTNVLLASCRVLLARSDAGVKSRRWMVTRERLPSATAMLVLVRLIEMAETKEMTVLREAGNGGDVREEGVWLGRNQLTG